MDSATTTNNNTTTIPVTTLNDGYTFPKIIVGCWQLSGGHGKINIKNALNDMVEYASKGLNTFDLADHYGPAEDLFGEVVEQIRKGHVKLNIDNFKGFTKWFPKPSKITEDVVAAAIKRSITRMKVSRIDLLQFHWWDYDDESYLLALSHLSKLQQQGSIRHIGLTNFDTVRLKQIVDNGHKIACNQVSYSIIDRRVERSMQTYCQENNIKIIAYGVCLGGLISEKFLGVPEPSQVALNTWSLSKYKDYINRWGGWHLFQDLLEVLKKIGNKHGQVSIPLVAIRYVLERPGVGAVVVGCRLGISSHLDEFTKQLYSFSLDQEDIRNINSVALKGDCLLGWGDCGDEFR
ncbi:hypothetical protein DFA_10944 [Cavenderia fasciculata]|uniref:NADP-dependent oxidoreductase domain-containing protein n=1 Tax=Cavenderia fasciculata TaxID=261658 RepID=F4QBU8_CACFS|nr:uncharacterized protein DFA_10944 [Cavenderia fasciculata]EGG14686.1 hypothetical protein DFA_10944 [Cavenderia fasciculata]|eukprot:XP_004351194.1 hypothetical protein DFA_10944 [Cavenderia fasciculata]